MPPRIVVLGEDLIWTERLMRTVHAVGGEPIAARDMPSLERSLPDASGVIVDLTTVRIDAVAAIERAHAAGVRVLAVGPHDDHDQRALARAAGAEKVLAYRKLFDDGEATIARWLGLATSDAAAAP